ncbi:hypothetical protein [Bifidobacterium aerophilum]|uniref:Uncharacterized protein n=1 Tax=Bifidobacterium aerophilum TaxID=1798155 RepID=A0A6N9Z868_9BIFI|nr:hypothetical protein [Bifidobacterium aerophilum]NEG90580.1 hypothetical protein [Bifidobacterium aerophilum]
MRKRNRKPWKTMRGLLLLLIPFIEGWCASYAFTHSWTDGNAGQIQITACFLLVMALPFLFIALIEQYDGTERKVGQDEAK